MPPRPAPPRLLPRLDTAGLTSILGAVADAGGELDMLHQMAGEWAVLLQVPVVDGIQQGWPDDLVQRFLQRVPEVGGQVEDFGTGSLSRMLLVTGLGQHAFRVHIRGPFLAARAA